MSFWACNIDRHGRGLRLASSVLLLLGSVLFYSQGCPLAAIGLAAVGLFTLFEAIRGWCIVRAFGFKTRY